MKNRDEVELAVKGIVMNIVGVEESCYSKDEAYVDMGADSLDLVELLMEVEEFFALEIQDEDAEKCKTPQQSIDYLCQCFGV